MNTIDKSVLNNSVHNKPVISAITIAILLGTSGCSGMSTRNKDTAIGAGAGAIAGGDRDQGSLLRHRRCASRAVLCSTTPASGGSFFAVAGRRC